MYCSVLVAPVRSDLSPSARCIMVAAVVGACGDAAAAAAAAAVAVAVFELKDFKVLESGKNGCVLGVAPLHRTHLTDEVARGQSNHK